MVGSPTKQTQPTVSLQPKGAEEAFSVLQKAQQESNLQMGQPQRVPVHYSQMARPQQQQSVSAMTSQTQQQVD